MDKLEKPQESMHKKAKLESLKALRSLAMDMIRDRSGEDAPEGMSKVTVAAGDKEGLKLGLDKAKDVLGEMPGEEAELEDESDKLPQEGDEEAVLLAKLEALRAKKKLA